ncbi:MAG: hypothetical protein RRZ73_06800 [Oscillospiraceae bacterium]
MGLFGKKEPCPICGGEVKGMGNVKISGGKILCRSCGDKVVMQKDVRKNADVDFIKEHLAHRENDAKLAAEMTLTHNFNFNNSLKVGVDTEKQLVSIEYDDWNSRNKPIVLHYSEIVGYELYRQNKKVDDDTKSGETFANTMTSVLGEAMNTSASNNDYITLKLKTTSKYWPQMDIILMLPNKLEHYGYKNNMSDIGNLFKCIVRGEEYVLKVKEN